MKKTLLAAIIAATALVPPAALAQDRGGRWQNRGGTQSTDNSGQARQSRGSWRNDAAQPAQAQPQAQAQTQAQPQRSWGGNRGNRGGDGQTRGSWRQAPLAPEAQAQQVQAQQAQQAQPQQQWRGNRGENRGTRGQWSGQQAQQQQQQAPQQQWRGSRGDNNVNRNNRGWSDRNSNRGWNDNRNSGWNDNRNSGSRWNNSWRSNNRYNWSGYRNSNRSLFRLPRYYAPSGWGYGYRRFGIGYTLNSILFGQQYWINDPFYYRLPEVDGPYRWVRYYNDALLVDIYTGEVVDTVYDIFW